MPEVDSFCAYRSLRLSDKDSWQYRKLSQDIIIARDMSHTIFVGGSNSWGDYLQRNGVMLPLSGKALERFGATDRSHYNHNTCRLLKPDSSRYLKASIEQHMAALQDLFGASNTTVIYHVSVLERLKPSLPELPMYFAILNSFLFSALKKVTLTNRNGEIIRIKFINVSGLFFSAKKPERLFKRWEASRGRFIHRTHESYREIYQTVYDQIVRDMAVNCKS